MRDWFGRSLEEVKGESLEQIRNEVVQGLLQNLVRIPSHKDHPNKERSLVGFHSDRLRYKW